MYFKTTKSPAILSLQYSPRSSSPLTNFERFSSKTKNQSSNLKSGKNCWRTFQVLAHYSHWCVRHGFESRWGKGTTPLLKFIDVNYFFLYTTIQIFFWLKRDVAMKGRNPWLYVSAPETYAGTAGKMELAKNICSEWIFFYLSLAFSLFENDALL